MSDRILATLSWSVAAILLGFFCLAHLGVLLCFSAGWRVSSFVSPAALLLALAAGDWLARREGLRGLLRIAPPVIALAVLGVSLFLSAAFFDLSWDGLWYHQTAVYQMAHGWNPLRDPLHGFAPSVQDSLRYYAKGPWYVALALFETAPHIEWAKPAPWMALAATFLAVAAAALDFGRRRRTAAVIAALVSLNPVVVCQLASYLVDGLLISFSTLLCRGCTPLLSAAEPPGPRRRTGIHGSLHQHQNHGARLSLLLLRRGGTVSSHPAAPPAAALCGRPARFHRVGRRGLRLQPLRHQYHPSRSSVLPLDGNRRPSQLQPERTRPE